MFIFSKILFFFFVNFFYFFGHLKKNVHLETESILAQIFQLFGGQGIEIIWWKLFIFWPAAVAELVEQS
jgi:hypothetical protein